jgi:hypothetical protein
VPALGAGTGEAQRLPCPDSDALRDLDVERTGGAARCWSRAIRVSAVACSYALAIRPALRGPRAATARRARSARDRVE